MLVYVTQSHVMGAISMHCVLVSVAQSRVMGALSMHCMLVSVALPHVVVAQLHRLPHVKTHIVALIAIRSKIKSDGPINLSSV